MSGQAEQTGEQVQVFQENFSWYFLHVKFTVDLVFVPGMDPDFNGFEQQFKS